MPLTAHVQCTVCGHVWTFQCASRAAALERLRATTVCPGRTCHHFRPSAEDFVNMEVEDKRDRQA